VAVISTPDGPNASLADGVRRLVHAGTDPLGRISLAFATRPLPDLLDEIKRWAALPIRGFFFDHAPSGPYQIGPVAQAVRTARRLGCPTIVLNAGTLVDPIYRSLPATICTFEGSWRQYLSRPPSGTGDGHLVVDVPVGELPTARALVLARNASLFLVTDRAAIFARAGAQVR
jgi:hypothetical protein